MNNTKNTKIRPKGDLYKRHRCYFGCACQNGKKVPVNVIGGFLGAGKTTFLNYILEKKKGEPTDVLIREYGKVPVDDKLVKNLSGRVHVFPGVTLHEDPQLVLHDYLHGLAGKNIGDKAFTRLLLETSGIDSPESLIHLFMVGYTPDLYRLGSFVVVVDAEYGLLNLQEYGVASLQVAFADVIILNKIDLATEKEIEELEKCIRTINAMAKIYRATYAQVDLEAAMDVDLYDQLTYAETAKESGTVNGIGTIVLSEKRPMSKEKVNKWLNTLFNTEGPKLLRSKGFFCFKDDDWRYEFQGVRKSFHSKADQLWGDEERKSTVVLIGENLPDEKELKASFAECVAD